MNCFHKTSVGSVEGRRQHHRQNGTLSGFLLSDIRLWVWLYCYPSSLEDYSPIFYPSAVMASTFFGVRAIQICKWIQTRRWLNNLIASDLVDRLSTKPIQFSGAFNFTSQYRGPPSPEIDAAWARYDFNRM